MLNERSPGSRAVSLMRELHGKEFKTAMQWESKYHGSWQNLNPFQSPPRLSPRLERLRKAESQSQSPASDNGRGDSNKLPSIMPTANSAQQFSPAPPSPNRRVGLPAAMGQQQSSPSPKINTRDLSASVSSLNNSSSSTAASSPSSRSPHTDRRTFHHLRHSDNRDAFYAQFIAKPKYKASLW